MMETDEPRALQQWALISLSLGPSFEIVPVTAKWRVWRGDGVSLASQAQTINERLAPLPTLEGGEMEMQVNVDAVKAARLKRAWSQEQLAGAAGLGVRTIQRVEASGVASNETVKCLAAVFECSTQHLLRSSVPPVFRRPWKRPLAFGAMASALLFSVAFFVVRAHAGEVMLDVVLGVGESNPKAFKLITEEGQKAEFRVDEQVRIVLSPTLEKNGRILLAAEVYGHDGKAYRLLATPKVLTGNGVDAKLDLRMGDGKRLQVSINPKRM